MKSLICTTLLVETSPQGLPLGAACIASAVKADSRTNKKISVELVDFSLEEQDICLARKNGGDDKVASLIANRLSQNKPDFLAFSVYVWNRVILEKTCLELKQILPECVCIAGGPEVTANPFSFNSFDFMIAGQGERAMVELLEQLLCHPESQKCEIQGVYARDSSLSCDARTEIIRACPLPPDVTVSPYLDGTLNPAKYGGALWELARGCPFKCSYCYESKGEKKIAYFPIERLEKEIELFAKKNISQVFVLDPTYNASKERAIKMLKIIEKKAPGMFFYFEARAEFIDRELARAFARIPCCLQIGLQSANPDVLKNVNRTLEKKRFIKNIGFLNEEGVIFGFDLIYGLPGDNFNGFCESIDFALSLYPNNLELFCLSVLPGTDLHDAAKGFGLEWEQTPPYHVLKTPQFNEKDLARAEKLAQATNLFYTKGRAVAWFNPLLYVLREKPSVFLKKFADWLDEKLTHNLLSLTDMQIEEFQLDFVRKSFHEKHLDRCYPAAEDLIKMHGALGRCTYDGSESNFTTNYHPDDVMSEYGTDIEFFTENCGKQKCRVKVFLGKNGADWRVV
ncbi:radical SAM protein [uncultured Treponema sp.]|uniref:B12-binding domain-containing radical SAM protein n=1 Tax=uncultured Treponema sp. TaxID=162155 RepID=UPI0025CFDFB7|nr:radical SAM protein [uncultured Treponema sp.]